MNGEGKFGSWEEAVDWLRHQPDKADLVADCYYDDPLIEAAERYWLSTEWIAVRELIANRNGNALDVGAGRGIASYALAREGFEVTALEPDPSDLVGGGAIRSIAAESHLAIHVVEEYSKNLSFSDCEFDVVFARAVLHHLSDLDGACREFYRVLKPGGVFIAIREHVISKPVDLVRFLEVHPLHRLYGGEHAYLLEQYIAAISKSGFKRVNVLSPWRSPVNFAPFSLKTLREELARRACFTIPGLSQLMSALLELPGVWPIARYVLELFDQRPGRLYSFVAEKASQ